ncbi:MAG: cardiolipin synthase [Bacilli bacterium]
MKKILKFMVHRLFIVAVMLIIQLSIILLVLWKFQEYFLWFYIINLIISLLLLLYIINGKDNPSYKIAWAIPILTIPIFGTFCYVMFGGQKISKKTKIKLDKMKNKKILHLKQDKDVLTSLKDTSIDAYLQGNYLLKLANYPIYQNTKIDYLKIGQDYYKRLIEELKKAKKYIFMEYFIIHEGVFWNAILEVLKQKVKEGLDVRVIYDDMGCIVTLPSGYFKYLETLGIKCCTFNRFVPVLSARLNNRDHRKITIIDGIVGFTGGINLADEYINIGSKYGHWKDNGIVLKGDAVWNFTVIFLSLWDYLKNEKNDYDVYKPFIKNNQEKGYVIPYDDSPLDNENVGENVYLNMINKAKKYIYIMTPYLIIDNEMMVALTNASKSGIKVKIITPGIPDKKMINEVTKAYYPQLLESNVEIYEYDPGFVHAKTFVVDDDYAIVGTINMDFRSLYLHFECGVWMYQVDSIKDIKKDYEETLEKCHKVTLDEAKKIKFFRNIKRSFLRLFAPLM